MKKTITLMLCALGVGMLFICGCSTTTFDEYHGSEIIQGKGGEMHPVDGIELWANGDPARKYKILGTIEESHGQQSGMGRVSSLFPNSGDGDSDIAKVARKNGGDAVIFMAKTPEPSSNTVESTEGQHGNRGGHRQFTLVVIKYVE
ncbi:MAG TPA: hypothetical protein VK815_16220 [Candidatus Acidoferrales bacterium]|jgi:hypothetical protein|nr:hypothetical protein [Candidatus Acidoferrales bacterium]